MISKQFSSMGTLKILVKLGRDDWKCGNKPMGCGFGRSTSTIQTHGKSRHLEDDSLKLGKSRHLEDDSL